MMRTDWSCSTRFGGCLVLAAVLGMLALPGSVPAQADKNIPVEITFNGGVQSVGGSYINSKSDKITAIVGRSFNIILEFGEAQPVCRCGRQ